MARTTSRNKPTTQPAALSAREQTLQAQVNGKRKARSFWGFAFDALKRDRMTLTAIMVLLIMATICFPLAGPITKALKVEPDRADLAAAFEAPSQRHPLGTDQVGRDQLARLIYGGRVSLGISFFAALIIMSIGVTVGMIAGYNRGIVDDLVMWFINTMNSIPFVLLLLIVALLFKPTAQTLTLFIGLMSWAGISRIVRGQVMQVREMDYITAAKALGIPTFRLAVRHILPNVIPIVVIYSAQIIGGVILFESALSFLGLGVQPPTATWGNMLTKAQSYFYLGPHLVLWPGIFISITVLCLYIIGDGLRDALDPMMRGVR